MAGPIIRYASDLLGSKEKETHSQAEIRKVTGIVNKFKVGDRVRYNGIDCVVAQADAGMLERKDGACIVLYYRLELLGFIAEEALERIA